MSYQYGSLHSKQQQHKQVPKKVNLRQEYDRVKNEQITTLMIRNIPNRYDQDELLAEIDQLGFRGCYDFFYMPVDVLNKCNVGYAFINFRTEPECLKFKEAFLNYSFSKFPSKKIGELTNAHLQGLKENVKHFLTSKVKTWSSFKPVVFTDDGKEITISQAAMKLGLLFSPKEDEKDVKSIFKKCTIKDGSDDENQFSSSPEALLQSGSAAATNVLNKNFYREDDTTNDNFSSPPVKSAQFNKLDQISSKSSIFGTANKSNKSPSFSFNCKSPPSVTSLSPYSNKNILSPGVRTLSPEISSPTLGKRFGPGDCTPGLLRTPEIHHCMSPLMSIGTNQIDLCLDKLGLLGDHKNSKPHGLVHFSEINNAEETGNNNANPCFSSLLGPGSACFGNPAYGNFVPRNGNFYNFNYPTVGYPENHPSHGNYQHYYTFSHNDKQ